VIARAELNASETAALSRDRTEDGARHSAAASIVAALVAGTLPDAKELSVFVRPDIATWLVAPRARAEDCAAIVAHAEQLASAPDFALEQFGLKYAIVQTWSGAQCQSRTLPRSTLECLTGSSSIPSMSKCEAPKSPWAPDIRRRIEGAWQGVGVDGPAAPEAKTAEAGARRTSLSVGSGATSFTLRGRQAYGALAVSEAEEDKAVLTLPVNPKPTRCVLARDWAVGELGCTPGNYVYYGVRECCWEDKSPKFVPREFSVQFQHEDRMVLKDAKDKYGIVLERTWP